MSHHGPPAKRASRPECRIPACSPSGGEAGGPVWPARMDVAPPELTLRAVLTGMALGALLTPCNVYSGLKIGWAFNMSIAAGLLSFGVWRMGEAVAATRPWTLLENNINQTAASSAASIISSGLAAPIPALTLLTGRVLPWPVLAFWLFAVSALGIVVAAGLRNQMLLRERLAFPAGVATAETIRDIHAHGREATARLKLLFGGALVSGGLKLVDALALALPRLAPPLTLPAAGPSVGLWRGLDPGGIAAGKLGFILDPSLLMLGFGAIIGLRAGLSLLLGAVLAWGVLGPWLLARGWVPPPEAAEAAASLFAPLVEWLLWPGVTLMVVAGLTSFAISMLRLILRRRRRGRSRDHTSEDQGGVAPTLSRRAFAIGLAATLILAAAAEVSLFGIELWAAVVAVLLSFVLATVAARVSGETGITPVGAMGKITQLTYGVLTPGDMTANLMTANVTGGAAGQCADLLQDLKTGHLIGATPRFQIVAQGFGVLTGSLVGSLVYLILIPDPAAMLITPEWPAPAVATWMAVAEVLAAGLAAIPPGAVVAMVLAAILGVALAVAEQVLPARLARWLPSAPAFGLAFVLPAWNALSLFLGALIAAVLHRLAPDWSQRRLITLAAGLVAGESIAGVAAAVASLLG